MSEAPEEVVQDAQQSDTKEKPWASPSAERVRAAMRGLAQRRRPTSTYRTRGFGMISSRRKDDESLWAHRTVTNLASQVFSTTWTEMQQHKVRRMPFKNIVSDCRTLPANPTYEPQNGFLAFLLRELRARSDKPWIKGNPTRVMFAMVYNCYNGRPGFTDRDFRVTSALREGEFGRIAVQILLWTLRVAQFDWEARRAEKKARKEQQRSTASTNGQHAEQDEEMERKPRSVVALIRHYQTVYEVEPHLAVYLLLVDSCQMYDRLCKKYEQAGKRTLPLGRFQDEPLENVKRREIRRVLERLHGEELIQSVREALKVLLNKDAYQPSRVAEAEQVRHPHKKSRKRQRGTRASYMDQYTRPTRGTTITLDQMRPYELEQLDKELADMQEFRKQLEPIRADIATFLRGKPPSFPGVSSVPTNEREARLHAYQTATDWFVDPFPSSAHPSVWEKYDSEQLEYFEGQAKARWLEAAGAVDALKLHPLSFVRAMRPKFENQKMSSFTIVFREETPDREQLENRYRSRRNRRAIQSARKNDRRPPSRSRRDKKIARDLARGSRYRFYLALVVHGKSAFTDYGDGTEPRRRQKAQAHSVITEAQRHDFYFVDAPYTRFEREKYDNILLFPLECLFDDADDGLPNGEQLLTQVVEQQRRAQENAHQHQCKQLPAKNESYRSTRRQHQPTVYKSRKVCQINLQPEKSSRSLSLQLPSLEERIPAATLTSAQVLCGTDNERNPQFRVYVPVQVVVPPVPKHITNAIAFTYHNEAFAYAVLAPEGHLLAVGEVFVPPHVRRKPDAINYSETYVHEITKEMARLAQQYHAYIGVEDISYLKDQPSSSRAENRELFAVPFSTMMDVLHDKALLAGLPEPHLVRKVPGKHACGQCGRDLARGVVAFSKHKITICTSCEARYAGKYLAVPVMLNPVAVICNVPKLGRRRLQMSGTTLAGIFLRAITNWNDPHIAADNPGVPLPDLPITLITDTNDASVAPVFNAYLDGVLTNADKSEEQWRAWFANGRGWLRVPSPFQARSVSETVGETEGAIGCVAWSPEAPKKQQVIAIQNQLGRFVQPSLDGIEKAGKALILEMQQRSEPPVLAGSPGMAAYPLTGVSWVRLLQDAPNAEQAGSAATFVSWLLTEGRAIAAAYGSLQVPTSVRDAALDVLRKMGAQDNGPVQPAVHTNGSEQETNQEKSPTLTPRLQPIPVSGAGAAAVQDAYQHWITHYRCVEPHVNLMLQPIHPDQEIDSEASCPACDRKTDQIEELHMNCRRCGTMLPTQYNRAVVTGRILQEQLVWRFENFGRDDEADLAVPDGTPLAVVDGDHDD